VVAYKEPPERNAGAGLGNQQFGYDMVSTFGLQIRLHAPDDTYWVKKYQRHNWRS
jgi:hypothetical protein